MSARFTILYRQEINIPKWDALVKKAAQTSIYGYSWYLDCVATRWGIVVDKDYTIGMPFAYNSKWGIMYVYQPYFTQQLGCFSLNGEDSSDELYSVLQSRYKFIEYAFNWQNALNLKESRFRPTAHLSLQPCYDELISKFNRGRKNDLNRCRKADVTVSVCKENLTYLKLDELIQLFSSEKKDQLSPGLTGAYGKLKSIFKEAFTRGMAQLLWAYGPDGELQGGGVFLFHQDEITFLFSIPSQEGRKNGVLTGILNEVIKKYAGTGKRIDFEGSENPNILHFYESFGARKVEYPFVKDNRLTWPLRLFKK